MQTIFNELFSLILLPALTAGILLAGVICYAINLHDCANRPEPGTSQDQEGKL